MNWGMTRWKAEPLKCSGLPILPMPFSPEGDRTKRSARRRGLAVRAAPAAAAARWHAPVQRARKFSAVCGAGGDRAA